MLVYPCQPVCPLSVPSKHATLTQTGPMLAHRLRRWPSIKPSLVQRLSVCSVSLLCCESVSDSFLSTVFHRTGGQTRDVDPTLS